MLELEDHHHELVEQEELLEPHRRKGRDSFLSLQMGLRVPRRGSGGGASGAPGPSGPPRGPGGRPRAEDGGAARKVVGAAVGGAGGRRRQRPRRLGRWRRGIGCAGACVVRLWPGGAGLEIGMWRALKAGLWFRGAQARTRKAPGNPWQVLIRVSRVGQKVFSPHCPFCRLSRFPFFYEVLRRCFRRGALRGSKGCARVPRGACRTSARTRLAAPQ